MVVYINPFTILTSISQEFSVYIEKFTPSLKCLLIYFFYCCKQDSSLQRIYLFKFNKDFKDLVYQFSLPEDTYNWGFFTEALVLSVVSKHWNILGAFLLQGYLNEAQNINIFALL